MILPVAWVCCIRHTARTECIHTGGLVLRGTNEWNHVNIYGTLGARDVGSRRGRMHAYIALFVTRLRRDYNSVDDRGRSWRLRFEEKERGRRLSEEWRIIEREDAIPIRSWRTCLRAGFFPRLYDSSLQHLIPWKLLSVVLEKLIESYCNFIYNLVLLYKFLQISSVFRLG